MNYFVTQIRGIGFTLPDIYSVRTALNIAKGIKVSVNVNFFIGTILLIIGLVICYHISNEKQKEKKNTSSIVTHMNSLNYKTIGIHSWYKTGYSRGKIYKYLGFDKSLFKEEMNNLEYEINEYSSDMSTYKYVIDELENKEKDKSIFEFVVTMQNHLPYIYQEDNGVQYVDNIYLNNYLQVQNKVDNALKYLIDYIDKYDEKTIVLFFGDHQPNLNLQDEYGIRSGIDEDEANYIVQYFITANYDINLEGKEEISTNYLESLLMKNTNLKKDSYSLYMED